MDVLPTGGGTVALLGSAGIDTFNRGNKFFELSNHLGNVLVTVSDRKFGQSPVNNLYTSFTADVVSATDYAPFGMQMVGRSFDAAGSTAYRYGFNGKENDNEVKGEGNQQDYGFRVYDTRLGKFLSIDPLKKEYPWYTPYQFAGNNPIRYIDLDGLEPANNPKSPGTQEKVAMVAVDLIQAGAAMKNTEDNAFTKGTWFSKNKDINGTFSCSNEGKYVTDTKKQSADKFNMYVYNGATLNVDESQASDFNNYESYVVYRLMKNFVSGEGPENYNFPENGIISSNFLNSDILKNALADFNSGKLAPGKSVQYSFGARELADDTWRNGTLFNITGLTGSGTITITPVNEQGVKVKIFNVTSLTSGDLVKNPNNNANWPKSYVRDRDKKTPYGNISQTYNLFIPWSSPLLSQQK
jgi:RHS repeat-associated protein